MALVLAMAGTVATALMAPPARAATVACPLLPPLDEVVATAPVVFIGTVIEVPPQMGEMPATVVFRVDEVWRGATVPSTVSVETNVGGVPATYRVGGTYRVVTEPRGSSLVDSCTATRELRTEHLQLRPPGAHLPDGTPIRAAPTDSGNSLPVLLGGALTAVGLLALLLMIAGTAIARWRLPLAAWLGATLVASGGAVALAAGTLSDDPVATDLSGSSSAPSASQTASVEPGGVLLEISFLTGFEPPDSQRVVVTQDGLVTENQSGTFLQRQLGPDALAALRAALFESGVFDEDANLFPVPMPGIVEPAHDGVAYDIVVHHPDGEARILATPYFLDVDAYEANPQLYEALRVATTLHVDAEPLGLADWTDAAAAPYQAAAFRLQAGQGFADAGSKVDLAAIEWPLDRPLDAVGPAVVLSVFEGALACTEVDAAAAESLLHQVQLLGIALGASASTRAEFVIQDLAELATYTVILTPLLPGDTACDPYPLFEVPAGPPADLQLEVGATAEIRVDDLRLRSEPTTAAEVVSHSIAGDRVRVVSGPQSSDGFVWFEVSAGTITGWVATGPADDPWLVPATGDPALVVLRLDTCTLVCDEILWYPGGGPSEARLVSRVLDVEPKPEPAEVLISGADDLLAELLASGLLDVSADYELPQLLPGAEPCACGESIVRTFVVRRDFEIVRVSWQVPPERQLYEEQAAADGLTRLAERIYLEFRVFVD